MTCRLQKVFSNGYQINFFITEYKAHSIELAKQAVTEQYTYIISIGGDGSLNEVVNGVMELDQLQQEPIKIGLLPKGTGNDFARTMNITDDLLQLKRSIDENIFDEIDLGKAEFLDVNDNGASRFFINITDVGMGGDIVRKMESYSNRMGTFITFQKAIVTTLFNYKKQKVIAEGDDFNFEGDVMVFAIANGKYFGGGLGIAPEAEINDGKFSVVIAGDFSMIQYLKLLGKLKKCKKINHPELKYFSASKINLKSNISLPIDMDGEFIGFTPLQISIVPKAIKFLSPGINKKSSQLKGS